MPDQPCDWEVQACTGDAAKPWRGQDGYCTGRECCWQFCKEAHKGEVDFFPPYGQKAVRVHTHQPGPLKSMETAPKTHSRCCINIHGSLNSQKAKTKPQEAE